MAAPTRTSFAQNDIGSGTSFTFPTGLIPTGSWMVVLAVIGSTAITVNQPSGGSWTTLQATQALGTGASRSAAVFGKVKAAGDTSTSYTLTLSGSTGGRAILMWGTGSDAIGTWTTGAVGTRTNGSGATSTTTLAPSITTTVADTLVLALNAEASAGAEYASVGVSNATEWLFFPTAADNAAECLEVAYLTKASPGATGNVVVTWLNANASNGWAVQIGIPPVGGTGVAVSGTVAAVSAASGAASRRLAVLGSVAGTSVAIGAISALLAVTGTVSGSSSASGTVGENLAVAGQVAASSAAEGVVTVLHPVAGQVDATSGVSGDPSAIYFVIGTAVATSGASGSAEVLPGPGLGVAGTVSVVSSASGTVERRLAVAGQVDSASGTSGAINARLDVAGTASASSDTEGAVTASLGVSGTVSAVSSASGQVQNGAGGRDITVTGSLESRRWHATLEARDVEAILEPRAWKGSIE